MRVLFVCTVNRLRSPTAETLFGAWPGVEALSAGTDSQATRVLDAEMVAWADMIFAMEKHHRERIRKKFKNRPSDGQITNLNIPDEYERDQPELIELLEWKDGPRIERAMESGT